MRCWRSRVWLLIIIIAVVGCGKDPRQTTEQAKPPLTYTAEERALLDSYVGGLAEIAKKSPTADSLLAFYWRAATLARPFADGQVQVLEAPKSNICFFVVPHTEIMTGGLRPDQGAVAAEYGNQIMGLHNNTFSKFVRGLMLGHELVHAEDELLNGEQPSQEQLSAEWLSGELHAHATIYQVLNEYTGGQWREMAIQSAHERRGWAVENGYSEAAMTFNATDTDSTRMVDMFGPMSYVDLSALLTGFTFDANMLNLKEVSADDMEKYQSLAGEYLYEFYSRYGAK